MYVVVDLNYYVFSPFVKKMYNRKFEILISSFFINGKIPLAYGDNYEISSNIFDINQKI